MTASIEVLAACASKPAEWWHPEPSDYETGEAAQRICATCPLKVQCRTDATDRGESHGVWGGLWFDRAAVRTLKPRKKPSGPKTHCKYGHPFRGKNLRIYVNPQGQKVRVCVTCRNDAKRRPRRSETAAEPSLDHGTLLNILNGVDGADFGIARGHGRIYVAALFELGWSSADIKKRLRLAGSFVNKVRDEETA